MTAHPEPIQRLEREAAELIARLSTRHWHPNKQAVFEVACPPDAPHAGRLGYTRWAAMDLPDELEVAEDLVVSRDGYFEYEPERDLGDAVEWHLNFADPQLFVACGSALFAQDEMQVAEHPALAALRQALDDAGQRALTVEDDRPTPVLVAGVERRCRIATDANVAEGRPGGLYGNSFGRARVEAVLRATTRLDPPTISNILAMAALPGGRGTYSREEICVTLQTAFTGFRAAMLESRRARGAGSAVVVHTGHWGGGAFGGNRTLMALVQVLAAHGAGVRRLVYHVGSPPDRAPLDEALRLLREELDPLQPVSQALEAIHSMGFRWGRSDGN